MEIEKDQAGRLPLEKVDRLLPSFDGGGIVSVAGEESEDGIANLGVVVDDENHGAYASLPGKKDTVLWNMVRRAAATTWRSVGRRNLMAACEQFSEIRRGG
jgi:hypothetical protein